MVRSGVLGQDVNPKVRCASLSGHRFGVLEKKCAQPPSSVATKNDQVGYVSVFMLDVIRLFRRHSGQDSHEPDHYTKILGHQDAATPSRASLEQSCEIRIGRLLAFR
jgi:hypothetical protein